VSVPVDPHAVETTAVALGDEALLVTVGDDAAPHVVSTVLRWRDGRVVADAGRRTVANAGANHVVTLLWPTPYAGAYRLIVDGRASVADDELVITPTSAILHRIAGIDGEGPTCLPVPEAGTPTGA
jgi:hypothetical protein